jgi:hypothetical protein
MKRLLLKNKYIKKLNNSLKLKKFYSNGVKGSESLSSVLFWSTGGMIIQTNLEAVIAVALKLRGHRVKMILCDGVYKACAKRVDFPDVPMKDWGKFCRSCIHQNSKLLERLGIDFGYIGDYVTAKKAEALRKESDKTDLENFKKISYEGIELGSHLESAMTRHTRGGSFEGLENLLKEYAFAVLVNAEASTKAMKDFKPEKVYMSHGIYADWGPALSVFLHNKIPVVSYICCYLTAHFFFGTVRDLRETFLTISEKSWNYNKAGEMSEIQLKRLNNFLDRRYFSNVTHDMKGLLKEYTGNNELYYEKYQLDRSKKIWGIMTHINWDAVSDYFGMIHKNFDEWLYETIKEIYDITDVQWLIKIHPSELNDNPDTGCQKFIEKNFPDLPPHIKVIKMDDDISPLDFYNLLDGGVTVMGTGGLELSLKGKPVILAGDAHYSNKGFTYDAKDKEIYRELLKKASVTEMLDDNKKTLASKYGYIYFIQKQIPLLPAISDELLIDFSNLNHLFPGKNKFIDFICEKIISGEDFIIPEELVELTHITDLDQIRITA